jgi:hypothetical protein
VGGIRIGRVKGKKWKGQGGLRIGAVKGKESTERGWVGGIGNSWRVRE